MKTISITLMLGLLSLSNGAFSPSANACDCGKEAKCSQEDGASCENKHCDAKDCPHHKGSKHKGGKSEAPATQKK